MNRIGFGYDSHRFEDGRPLILGGVRINHPQGLAAHSNGDAVLHAVTDAILGAIAADDIGEHFPNTDPANTNADSARFVRHAVELAATNGYLVVNCDITIIAEAPKLGEHKLAMREAIAHLLGVCVTNVAVKAKTNEQMGPIGRGEGIAAMAAVMLCSNP